MLEIIVRRLQVQWIRSMNVDSCSSIAWTLVAALTGIFAFAGSDIYVTVSGSLPSGIYRRTNDLPQRGSLALFCPPANEALEVAHERGYVEDGPCSSNTSPFGKMVAGVPGDTITVDSTGVFVNSRFVLESKPSQKDSKGRAVHPFYGRVVLGDNHFFMYSPYVPSKSFDSRSFGAVEGPAIVVEPVAVFESVPEWESIYSSKKKAFPLSE